MKNGTLRTICRAFVCGVILVMTILATNIFAEYHKGTVHAETISYYTATDSKATYQISVSGSNVQLNGYEFTDASDTEVVIPSTVSVDTNGDSVADTDLAITTIGEGAFSNKTTITSVELPSSVTTIADAVDSDGGAFSGCTSLVHVVSTGDSLVSIGDYAFYGCSALKYVGSATANGMTKVTKVGIQAFDGAALTGFSVSLNSISVLGYNAFNITTSTHIYIPYTLTNIQYYSQSTTLTNIKDVTTTTEVVFASNVTVYTRNSEILTYLSNIGKDNKMTSGVTILSSSDSVCKINEEFTLKCRNTGYITSFNWYNGNELIATSDANTTVGTISTEGIRTLRLVGVDAFGEEVESTTTHQLAIVDEDNYKYFIVVDGVLTSYTGTESEVEIPEYLDESLEYGHIESIEHSAFRNNTTITRVVLPTSINAVKSATSSGRGAFYSCTNLIEVVSIGGALTSIGDYAFYGCTSLQTLSTDNLVTIGKYALYNCSALTTIGTVDNKANLEKVTSIGSSGLYNVGITSAIYLKSIEELNTLSLNVSAEYIYIPKNAIKYDSTDIQDVTSGKITNNSNIWTENENVIKYLDAVGISYKRQNATITSETTIASKGETFDVTATLDEAMAQYITSFEWLVDGVSVGGIDQETYAITINSFGDKVIGLQITNMYGETSVATGTYTVKVLGSDNYKNLIVEEGVLVSATFTGTDIVIPEYVDMDTQYNRITSVAKGVIPNTATSIILPISITEIESTELVSQGIFANYTALTMVDAQGLVTVGDYAFYGCTSLQTLKVDGLVNVGKQAFYNCPIVTVGTIANVVNFNLLESVGQQAFYNNAFASVVLPKITTIGVNAFSTTNQQEYIYIGNNENISVLSNGETTPIRDSGLFVTSPSTTIYTINDNVIAYATTNGLTYETLSVSITANKVDAVKNDTISFTSTFTGKGVTYQWNEDGEAITSATNSDYELTKSTAGGYEYSLVVTDMFGNTVESNKVTVRYYSDNTYKIFVIDENGILIKYNGTATDVIVPEYVDSENNYGQIVGIGAQAFSGNTNIVTVQLSASIATIENATLARFGAFYGCTNLEKVTITNGLVSIGDYAFYGCSKLQLLTINGTTCNLSNVTYLGIQALSSTAIKSVNLSSIETIGHDAINSSSNIEYIVISGESKDSDIQFKTADGNIYSIESDNAVGSISNKRIYTNNVDLITFLSKNNCVYTVTNVGIDDLDDYSAVVDENVELHATITGYGISIKWYKDGSLIGGETSATLSTTSSNVGSVIYTVVVTDEFGDSYEDEVTITYYANANYRTFKLDSNGVLIKYNGDSSVINVVIPEYLYDGDESTKVTGIGAGAFTGNTDIIKVTIPTTVTKIYDGTSTTGAFSGCTKLTTVEYHAGITYIGDYAFFGATSFTTLTIDGTNVDMSHVTYVGVKAFGTTALGDVALKNIEVIGEGSFLLCSNMSKLGIGNTQNIKVKTVAGALVNILDSDAIITATTIYTKNSDVISYATRKELVVASPSVVIGLYEAIVDDEGEEIPELDRVIISEDLIKLTSETVTLISRVSGMGASLQWYVNDEPIVGAIEKTQLCQSDVTSKNVYTLKITDSLGNVTTSNEMKINFYLTMVEYEFIVEEGTLIKYNGTSAVVTVPSEVSGETIESIGIGAFRGNTAVVDIALANTITTIDAAENEEESAFYGCTSLQTISGTGLLYVGDYAFYNRTSLQSVLATNIQTIGRYAFYQCNNLSKIGTVNGTYSLNTVEYVGAYAFMANAKVETMYLNNVAVMGEYAIRACVLLKTTYLGDKLKNIVYIDDSGIDNLDDLSTSNRIFYQAAKLSSDDPEVIIPDGIVYVYDDQTTPIIVPYFNRINFTYYVDLKINNVSYEERVVKGTNVEVTATAQGLNVTYKWSKNGVEFANTANTTITENVAGDYTYTFTVTDTMGNSVSKDIEISFVEHENELYYVVESGVLTEYKGTETNITIPTYMNGTDGEVWITDIGTTFSGNTNITSIKLNENIVELKDGAFRGCTNLQKVVATSALTVIGHGAFTGATNLTLFVLDELSTTSDLTNVVSVGVNAFSNTALDKVVLTNIEKIGAGAFNNVSAETIYIGNKPNIKVLSESAVARSVTYVETPIAESTEIITNKTIYSTNEDVVEYANANAGVTLTTLSASIVSNATRTTINKDVVFTSVVTGDNLTYAWYKDDVAIENETNATLTTTSSVIGEFTYKLVVTDIFGVTFTSNEITVEYVKNDNFINFVVENNVLVAYLGSESSVVVPDALDETDYDTTITTIGLTAFRGNKSVTSITFGVYVTSVQASNFDSNDDKILNAAFYGCSNLTHVKFTGPGPVTIGTYAFYGCSSLVQVEFDMESATIQEYAFYNCANLTKVVASGEITVSPYSFTRCSSLTTVGSIDGVVAVAGNTLYEHVFNGCSAITNINMTNIVNIETCALLSCTGIKDLMLLNVQNIASNAINMGLAQVNIVVNKDILSTGLPTNAIVGSKVTLYSTLDSYVAEYASNQGLTFVGVNITGYDLAYTYPINSNQTITVEGVGYGELTYTWYKNGVSVQTGSSNSLSINSTSVGQDKYYVMVSDGVGYTNTSDEITVNNVKDYYDVEVSYGTDGVNTQGALVSYDDSVEYLGLTIVEITILAEHSLKSVVVNGDEIDIATLTKVDNVYTYIIENVDKDYSIVITTMLVDYTIEIVSDENVILYVNSIIEVESGANALVLFGLEEHYVIDGVTINGQNAKTNVTYDSDNDRYSLLIDSVVENLVINITTKYTEYLLTLDVSVGGSVNVTSGNYVYNTSINITPTANENYVFDKMYVNGVEVSLVEGTYTFNISTDTTVDVDFKLVNKTVTVNIEGGSISQSTIVVPYGNKAEIEFVSLASGVYSIDIDGVQVDDLSGIEFDIDTYTYTIDSVTSDIVVNIVMGVNISINTASTFTVSPTFNSGVLMVPYGASQNVVITAISGYILSSVTVGGVESLHQSMSTHTISLENITTEENIVVSTNPLYTFSASITNGNIVTPSSAITVESGKNASVVFSVNEHFVLDTILVNNETQILSNDNLVFDSEDGVYTFTLTDVQANTVVQINTALKKVNISLDVGANGSVTVGENTYINETIVLQVTYNGTLTINITPSSEYVIDRILYNGEALTNATTITIKNIVLDDNTLAITFALRKYSVTVLEGDANVDVVSPTEITQVSSGGSITIEYTFASHYHLDNIKVNGVVYDGQITQDGDTYSITLSGINGDKRVEIYSAIDTYTVTSSVTNGTVSPSTVSSVEHGSTKVFTLTPFTNYTITNENISVTKENGSDASWTYANGELTVTNIDSNITIRAEFMPITVYYVVSMEGDEGVQSLDPSVEESVEAGSNVEFVFTLKEHYLIDKIQLNNATYTGAYETVSAGVYKIIVNSISQNTSFIIETKLETKTLNVTSGANGSLLVVTDSQGEVTPDGDGNVQVSYGDAVTITFVANDGYVIDTITIDGVAQVVASTTYEIDSMTSDVTVSVTFKEKAPTYTVIADIGVGGTLTNSSVRENVVEVGQSVTIHFMANLDEHYHLNSITLNEESLSIDVNENTYLTLNDNVYSFTIPNVTSDYTLYVTFDLDTIDINVTIVGDGSVEPSATQGVYTVDYGSNQEFTFTAAAGYYLYQVKLDGTNLFTASDENTVTFTNSLTNISATHTYVAEFMPKTNEYVVNVTSGVQGGIITSGSGRNVVTHGDSHEVRFTVDTTGHYTLNNITLNAQEIDVTDTNLVTNDGLGNYVLTISNITEAINVHITFKLEEYAITFNYNDEFGSVYGVSKIENGSSIMATYGSMLVVEVAPNAAYELLVANLSSTISNVGGSGMYYTYSDGYITIYSVSGEGSFTLTFTKIPVFYTVEVSGDTNVTIVSDESSVVGENEYVDIQFTLANNYEINTVLVNNESIDISSVSFSGGVYTLRVQATEDKTIEISTKLVSYNINITTDTFGKVVVAGIEYTQATNTTSAIHGSNVVVSVVPNAGYEIATVVVDGESQTVSNKGSHTFTITNITKNVSISVTFSAVVNYHVVTVSSSAGGDITNVGRNTIAEGHNFEVDITPHAYYEIDAVTVNDVEIDLTTLVESSGTYTLTLENVTEEKSINVTFKLVSFVVTFNVSEHGVANINGIDYVHATDDYEISVVYGTSLEFIFVADTGYKLDTMIVDGENVTNLSSTYTVANIVEEKTIYVTFAKQSYVVNITSGANGHVSDNEITVEYNGNVTFDIVANEGYEVSQIFIDGVNVSKSDIDASYDSTEGKYTFAILNVVSNRNVEILFALETLDVAVTIQGSGSADVDSVSVNYATSKTIHFYPETNYHLVDVLDNGTSVLNSVVSQGNNVYAYTLTNILVDHSIVVKFAIDKVEVNTTLTGVSTSATVSTLGTSSVDYNGSLDVEITINSGYVLQNVLVNGEANADFVDKVAGSYTCTITNIVATTTIEVVVVKDTYTITLGSGITADGNSVGYKQDKVIYIVPTTNNDVSSITVDGNVVSANDLTYNDVEGRYEYTLVGVTKDMSISMQEKAIHSITASVVGDPSGATIVAKNGKDSVATGDDKVYVITLTNNYYIYSIVVSDDNGDETIDLRTLVNVDDAYYLTLEDVDIDKSIVLTISNGSYMITVEYGDNGKTLPDSDVGISYPGESKTIVLYPNTHYTVDYVVIDGDDVNKLYASDLEINAQGFYEYTFENVIANHSIYVAFKLIDYIVTVNYHGENGGSMTASKYTITNAESLDFSVLVNSGYVLTHVTKDGTTIDTLVDKSTGNYGYSLSGVTNNVVFDVYYTLSAFDINVDINDDTMGSVTYDGTLTVDYKANKTIEFVANSGYILKDVKLDGESVMSSVVDNTLTIENVTSAHVVYIEFAVARTITIENNNPSGAYVDKGNGDYLVVDGASADIGIYVNYGYMLLDILVDGTPVTDIDSLYDATDGAYHYVFDSVTANHTITLTVVKTNHMIYITKNNGGQVNPYSANGISVAYAQDFELSITPYTNYVVKSITINGEDVTDSLSNNAGVYTYTIIGVNNDFEVEILFANATSDIIVTAIGQGSIEPQVVDGKVSVVFNGSQAFTFTADADNVISSVTIDGILLPGSVGVTQFSYMFTRVQETHTVNVVFVKAEYAVNVDMSTANGTIDKVGNNVVAFGTNFTFNVLANSGYLISSILVGHEYLDLSILDKKQDGSYDVTITNVTSDIDIEVSYVVAYDVTVTINNDSYGYVDGDRVVASLSTHTYTIKANAGYMVESITIDGVALDITTIYDSALDCYNYTFDSIEENHTIDVVFVQAEYSVTIVTSDGCVVSQTGTIEVAYGDDYTVTMSAMEHYHLVSVMLNGVDVTSQLNENNGEYTLTIEDIKAKYNVVITFELDEVTIDVIVNNTYGGYVVPGSIVTLRYGQNQTYNINVYDDYVLESVLINGVALLDLDSIKVSKRLYVYEFVSVTSDQTIEVTFASAKYYMENTSSNGGTISTSQYVNYGDDYKCYFTPNEHYVIASLTINGETIDVNTLHTDENGIYYEFTNVKANYNIRVAYELEKFTITVNIVNDTYGVVDYASNMVVYGGSMTFNISAYTDYLIASVVVDGVAQQNLNTYVFTSVTENHTIDITFAKKIYTVELDVLTDDSTGIISAPSTVSYGQNLIVRFAPSAHYKLSKLYINGVEYADVDSLGDTLVIENVNDDYVIEAEFEFTHYDITITNTVGGTITGSATANPQDSKDYKVEVSEGYYLDKLYVDGVEVTPTLNMSDSCYYYTISDINDDHTISAEFIKYTYTVTFILNNSALGFILPAPSNNVATVEYGDTYTCFVQARDGYIINKVTVNGTEVAMVNSNIILENITENLEVRIEFVINMIFGVSLYAPIQNATVTFDNQAYVGEVVEIAVTPNQGYKLDRVVILDSNGVPVTFDMNTMSFVMPFSNVTIQVAVSKIVVEEPIEPEDPTPDVPKTPSEDENDKSDKDDKEEGMNIVLVIVLVVVGVLGAGAAITVFVVHIVKSKKNNIYRSK